MKKKNNRAREDREVYLSTDLGDALARLEPLKLDLEFASPTQAISIRLPRQLLNKIKILADERDVPYQSLIKILLAKSLESLA